MKPGSLISLALAAALALPAAAVAQTAPGRIDSVTALALKRVAERYALTKSRISLLVDPRRNPVPLAASLPNPFYRQVDLPPGDPLAGNPGENPVLPNIPDESDEGTLAKFAASVRISGLTVLNGVPHLTLNGALCKGGDTIPLEARGRTVYIQVLKITPDELTLGLNQERTTVRVKR